MTLRPLIQGTGGVVVSGHPSASLAGLDILCRGGNAIDAGVAVGLALNVVHVHECGFLGVAPTIIYLADRREVTTIDGVGAWPKAVSLDYFLQVHQGILPPGILRTITPGAADAWFMALSRYGTMSFGDVAGAAIELAGKGFPMHRYLAQQLRETQDRFESWPTTAEVLMPGGRLPQVGEMFYQGDLANTLAQIAGVEEASRSRGREGALTAARDFVYKGELAERIASFCQAEGGTLTLDDIAASGARWEPPVIVNYRGLDVYACGPWGQGPVFPQALKTLEGFNLVSMGHNSDDYIHTITQALNLSFADLERYVGDPDFVDVPMEELLSGAYLQQRRALIDPARAWPEMPPPGDPRNSRATLEGEPQSAWEAVAGAGKEGEGTAYFAVVDGDGNVFSCTPSEGTRNGGPIVPGTGMVLNLRGSQSKVLEGHPAAIAPGKRPRVTPAPALALRDGHPVMALGGHGGDRIPQGMLQTFLNMVEFGMNPQEAVEAPRVYTYNFPDTWHPSVYLPGLIRAEGRIPKEVIASLERRGHKVEMYPDWWEGSGFYGVISRDPHSGVLQGGADPRCEAYGLGY